MPRLFLFKTLKFFCTLAAAVLVVFLVLEVLPGDAASLMLGINASEETLAALRVQMGLDRPWFVRFLEWIRGIAVWDLGDSQAYQTPVADLIWEKLKITVPLALLAFFFTVLIALPFGVFTAAFAQKKRGFLGMAFLQLGVSLPNFWLGMLLVLLFSVHLDWLPAGGFGGWEKGFWPALSHLLLPAFSLAVPQSAILARVIRSAMLETMNEDFVRTARSKGLGRTGTLFGHVLPNAMIPVLTLMGLQFSFLVAGTVIVENVFYLPGLGRLIFQTLIQRDLTVLKNIVVLLVALVVLVNYLVDALVLWMDPRIRG